MFQSRVEPPGSLTPPACGSGNFLTFQIRAESPGSLTRAVPPSIRQLFQSRAKPPGSLTLREGTLRARCFRAMPNHPVPIRCLHTHPHTGTRATTAKDSPRASASPTPFAPTRADPVASSASNAGSPPAVPAPFGRERIGQGRFPVHMAGSLPPRSSFDRPTC